MKNEKKTVGLTVRARLSELTRFALPARCGYRMEVEGRGEELHLLLYGVDRILTYTEEEVSLLCEKTPLFFLGRGLTCLSYGGMTVEITGRVERFCVGSKEMTP